MTVWDEITEPATVKRDRFGRPIIEGRPWQRATTFAGLIADKAGLIPWAQEMTARGLAQRPDLLATVAANLDDKSAVRKAAESAKEHGGGSQAATLGTALHRMTELNDLGRHLPELHNDRIEQYRACLDRHGIGVLPEWVEQLVVNDAYGVAGTPDRIVRWRGRHVIADLKTGRDLTYSIGEIAVQLHVYASATAAWDAATESRLPLPEIDQDVAVVFHMPAQGDGCELVEVDIAAGREAAERCLWVRDWRKRRDLMRVVEPDTPPAPAKPKRGSRTPIPKPDPRPAIDEGATLDRADCIARIRKGLDALAGDRADEVGPRLNAWVAEGRRGGNPWGFTASTGTATERRMAIFRAAVRLALIADTDDDARDVIAFVGLEVQPAMTVGAALGALTIPEATALIDVADGIASGAVALVVGDGGHLKTA